MSFQLQKNQGMKLSKSTLAFLFGLGWDIPDNPGPAHDLDANIFGLGADGKLYGEYAAGYFLIPAGEKSYTTPDGALTYGGDNRSGAGDGDDETITVNQNLVDANVQELAIWITMHDAVKNSQHFGQVKSAFVRVVDDSGQEICRFDMSNEFIGDYAVHVGSMLRQPDGSWKFTAVGVGFQQTLAEVITGYGGQVS